MFSKMKAVCEAAPTMPYPSILQKKELGSKVLGILQSLDLKHGEDIRDNYISGYTARPIYR